MTQQQIHWPTILEAAKLSGLPPRYVRRIVEERRVASAKLDRRRVDMESLRAYIASRTDPAELS